ncbi:hypothetical protein G4Y79_22785 [Phototrophicus methaneseepsis]|uniref:Uncharacterized protein n=1 Tax=Phototrophicus methaneseepsis TaxID=2710758 RepID=A0A7S8E8Y9_9CHLR|nr:hypothetical protein [Phototrophicus methaneseepsis]QPC82478.1 hypothetical protein G4Y79_22785 [Phototrophicus methaneseepsis]
MSDSPQEQPQQSVDVVTLRKSQAGMRFIAQMHIYNMADAERLRTFITESYHDDVLAQADADTQLAQMQAQYTAVGKVKVKQVLAANEYHVIVVMQAQKQPGMYFYVEVKVEEEYPHKIIGYMFQPMQEVNG